MRSFYYVYEEDRSELHMTGWVKINQFSTEAKAERFCNQYINKHPEKFSPNLGIADKQYLLIERNKKEE